MSLARVVIPVLAALIACPSLAGGCTPRSEAPTSAVASPPEGSAAGRPAGAGVPAAEPVIPARPAPPPPAPRGAVVEPAPASEGPIEKLIMAELDRTEIDGRRLVIYVGATWCEPCRRFHDAVAAGELDQELGGLRFLEFDFDVDGERLAAAGYAGRYLPLFVVPGPDGRATDRSHSGGVKGPGAVEFILPRLKRILDDG